MDPVAGPVGSVTGRAEGEYGPVVGAPLVDVVAHVVEAPGVGLFLGDAVGVLLAGDTLVEPRMIREGGKVGVVAEVEAGL
jgi:hypothetical protein